MNKLTGITWAYNGISQDYCLAESVESLKEFCDQVIVLDAGSLDGTAELIKSFADEKTRIIVCENDEWNAVHGKEKLSYFTNLAIAKVDTEWLYSQQADEVTSEHSYSWIKHAINQDAEGFLITRINLWGDPYHELNVDHSRKPCSTQIARIAKVGYYAYDDAESIAVPADMTYLDKIVMYHMGFVRRKDVHCEKIRHMQKEIFQVGVDPKLEGMTVFQPEMWFDPEKDLTPIKEPLPRVIQKWAKERE